MGMLGRFFTAKGEKRKSPRTPYEIAIDYSAHNRIFTDHLVDIGRGGVFIRTEEKFATGQKIVLTIPLDPIASELQFEGEVIRKNDNGIGVRFEGLSPDRENLIKRFVDRLRTD